MEQIIFEFMADDGLNMDIMHHALGLIEPLPTDILISERALPKERNNLYFEITIPRYTDGQFKEHFRMNRTCFEKLLNVIGNHMAGTSQTNISVPLAKKVLFTIWLLSKQESFLAVGDRFDIATSSGHVIFKTVIYVLAELMPNFVKWPNAEQQALSSQIFEERSHGICNVVGAIDGCHIPIKQPVGNANDYFNRKQIHSVILQGVCDHAARFIDVFIGMPGKMHDARVFRNSQVFQRLTNQENPLLRREQHLLGDCAYPLLVNLMTPFRDNGRLPQSNVNYNIRLSSIRTIIERAFGRLKGKFRRLKFIDADNNMANYIIAASCMLHNFIIDSGETVDENYMEVEVENVPSVENADIGDLPQAQLAVEKRLFIVNNL